MKLNLGSGDQPLEGYENWDRKTGQEAYPLAVPDGSVEEIRASHVLEHFSHRQVGDVINHWAQKLMPGGCLKLAVPDFEWIAKGYLAGEIFDIQGYTMGSQGKPDDEHRTVFDRELLTEVMASAGLERIGKWKSELQDCASLPVSLNLVGFKPVTAERRIKGVTAALSAPRFGPIMHMRMAFRALSAIGVPYQIGQGAYWHQVISELLEEHLAGGADFILTADYDTIFAASDVLELYRLMRAFPEADAICPVQSKRGADTTLFGMVDKDGKARTTVTSVEFERNLTPISSGHFGLTMFRAASLGTLPRPWMVARPAHDGRWAGETKIDADMDFWRRWSAAGKTLFLANRVVVGHLQEAITWPGKDFAPVYQQVGDYEENGIPAEVNRCSPT